MSKFKYQEDSKCPYCGEKGKPCSNVNNMTRAYARKICAKKHNNVKLIED